MLIIHNSPYLWWIPRYLYNNVYNFNNLYNNVNNFNNLYNNVNNLIIVPPPSEGGLSPMAMGDLDIYIIMFIIYNTKSIIWLIIYNI
jgi:hypothetical protein